MKQKISKKIKAGIMLAMFIIAAGTTTIYMTTVRADQAQPYGEDYITKYNVFNATFHAIDNETGVDYSKIEVWYAIDPRHPFALLTAETNITEGQILTYTTQGVYQFHYYSVDFAGNIETRKIDTVILWNSDTIDPYSWLVFT